MGKIEELYLSVVEQFANAHIKDPTGQTNFIRFMSSLYDLDEDPIYKDWLDKSDGMAEVVSCYQRSASPIIAAGDDAGSTNGAGVTEAVSGAATAGSSPASRRCFQLNVADILSTYENRILGTHVTKQSSRAVESKVSLDLSREVERIAKENIVLEEELNTKINTQLAEHAPQLKAKLATLCQKVVMQDHNDKRSRQNEEWRVCKTLLDELLFDV